MALEDLTWDINPMEADYYAFNLNSYDKRAGVNLQSGKLDARQKHEDQGYDPLNLYIWRIPSEMTEIGLRNAMISLGCPRPNNVRVLRPKSMNNARENFSYGFADFETPREASEALQALDKRPPFYFRVKYANKIGNKERSERTSGTDFNINVATKQNADSNDWRENINSDDDKPVHTNSINANTLTSIEASKNSTSNKPKEDSTCSRSDFVDHLHAIVDDNCVINPNESVPGLLDISCSSCGKRDTNGFKLCMRCHKAFYCDKKCQIAHWLNHKKQCLKELVETAEEILKDRQTNKNEGSDNISTMLPNSAKSSDSNIHKVNKESVEFVNNQENIAVHLGRKYKEIDLNTSSNQIDEKKVKEKSLKIGDVFAFFLTFGSSPDNFFMQKTEDVGLACSMSRILCDECSKMPVWEDAIKLKVGHYCAAFFEADGFWYRAKVLEKSGENFHVEFVDFGNDGFVNISNLRPLPASLYDFPILAIHCKIRGISPIGMEWSSAALEDFNLVTDRKDFNECHILDRDDNGVYLVDLFGPEQSLSEYLIRNKHAFRPSTQCEESRNQQMALEKQKSRSNERSIDENIQKRDEGEPPNIPSYIESLKNGKTISAMITTVHDSKNFKFCLLFDVQSYCDISGRLEMHFKKAFLTHSKHYERLTNAKVGKIVAIQSSDEEWHRALIMKLNEDGCFVCLLIDSGIIETVDSVYKLPEECFATPSLFGLAKVIIPFSKSAFKQLEYEDPIEVSICVTSFKGNQVYAKMNVTKHNINCHVSIKSYLNAYKEMLTTFESELEQASVDELFVKLPRAAIKDGKLLVLYQDPEDEWIIYGISNFDVVEQLVKKMEKEVARGRPIISPKVGMYCLAKCETDAEWYRAMIVEIGKESCKVYFLDFGDYGQVVNSDLKTIEDDYSPNTLPSQAIKCIVEEEHRSPEAMKKINASKNDGECLNVTELKSENFHVVIMLNDV
ncbi:tudor domain-containing protein 1-like protein [Dinothrombium tinctorium]|uniref:Tudor domain-containing protein 1-like protein n=1 Tax=Dinothrombium tinctorium TaxID=1965070 RepID=A0A3S3RL57_9ACAR|nr:tudor domain-containing protein 1-like protein [Dinothrombium tinctorium]